MSSPVAAPLVGLRVVDLSVGMAPALAAALVVGAGAEVTRIEPPGGDPFYDVYPAYDFWQRGKIPAEWTAAQQDLLLSGADLCIVGGEDYPGLDWAPNAAELHRRYLGLTVLEFRSQPEGFDEAPAVDLLAQARSGLSFEHFTDRPIAYALAAPSYGAALNGLVAALASIYAARRGAPGRHVSTSLLQGALFWGASLWLDIDGESSREPSVPKDPRQLIFRCSDGVFIQITMGVPGALGKLYKVLGIEKEVSATDRGVPTGKGNPRHFFGDVDLIAPYFAARVGSELLAALVEAGLVAEKVAEPGECWDDPQTYINGIITAAADGTRGVGLPFTVDVGPPGTPPAPTASVPRLPLEGVRVVDFGMFVAGPLAVVLLVDLGAEVIKVEPIGGDPLRGLLRQYAPGSRGKCSIAVDAKDAEGNRVARRLAAGADIVSHNFRPGVSARLGIDRATLATDNPDVVVLECSAYGAHGPKSSRPGFDMVFQAICGLEDQGGTSEEPMWYRFSAVDYATALLGAAGVLIALISRTMHGAGAEVATNLLNGSLFLMSELIEHPGGTLAGMPRPVDDDQLGRHPAERLYQAADGWIAVAARDPKMALRLVDALGIADVPPRSEWGSAQVKAIGDALAGRSVAEALELLEAADVWAVRCESDGWAVIKADPRYAAAGIVGHGAAPGHGTTTQIMRAFDLDGAGPQSRHQGLIDTIGGHTHQILAEYGFADDNIGLLIQTHTVASTSESLQRGGL
jgi:crotonobetainyl-CoA:carnitine CoA-transferase CaiB-like acyl-CoA transferase